MKTVLFCQVLSVMVLLILILYYIMVHSFRYPPKLISDERHIGRGNDRQHNQFFSFTPQSLHDPIHVFSAVANLVLTTKEYDSVFINVWYSDLLTTMKCCFKYKNGDLQENVAILFHYVRSHAKVYKCVTPMAEDLPYEVSLLPVKGTQLCADTDTYTTVVYPKLHTEELALCVKAAYGHLDPKELICWIEYHVFMGVDKIFFLVKNIDDMSMRVLDYYSDTGLIEMVNFTFQKVAERKNDVNYQHIATFDCQERMRGYSFAGLLDIDEYMIPKLHRNLKDLIKFYLQKYNNAAGITFLVEFFFKEWEKQKPDGVLDPLYYFERSDPLHNRVKSIHIPNRTKLMSVNVHGYEPTQGHRFVTVNSDIGTLHHYRKCPMEERFYSGNCSKMNRYTDKQMLDFRNLLEGKVWRTWKSIKTMYRN